MNVEYDDINIRMLADCSSESVLCGAIHTYESNMDTASVFLIEKKVFGRYESCSEKCYWLLSNSFSEVKVLWLVVGKYRVIFKDDLGKMISHEVRVVRNSFKLEVKSQKFRFSSFGWVNFPITVIKKGGAKNNWRFKYRVSLDDGVSWGKVHDVFVNYCLYEDVYRLNYSLYICSEIDETKVKFKLVDGRDFNFARCGKIDREKVFVLKRRSATDKRILFPDLELTGNEQVALSDSESEYSCVSRENQFLAWRVFQECEGRMLEADKDYRIVGTSPGCVRIKWGCIGTFVVCAYRSGGETVNDLLESDMLYKQKVKVVKNDFSVKVKFKEITSYQRDLQYLPVVVNKIGGLKKSWKFKYQYGIVEEDFWSEKVCEDVDYNRFGDVCEFGISKELIKRYKGRTLMVKILGASDYSDEMSNLENAFDKIRIY